MKDATTGLRLVHHSVTMRREDGGLYLISNIPLDPVVARTADWLHHWADKAPDRVFLSERADEGWRDMTYAGALDHVRAIAAALIVRGMDLGTPVAILSGNSVDHALLSFGAQYACVPTVPLASNIR